MLAPTYEIRIVDAADERKLTEIDVVLRIDGDLRIERAVTPYLHAEQASDLIVMSRAAGGRMLRAELWSDASGQAEMVGACKVRSVLIIESPHGHFASRCIGGS